MIVSPDELFLRDIDSDVISFKQPNTDITFSEIKKAVAKYASFLSKKSDTDYILFIENDIVLFCILFFALIQAQKRVMLPSSEKMATDVSATTGVKVLSNIEKIASIPLNIPNDCYDGDFEFVNMRNGKVCFFTSGSTSAPKLIEKDFATLSDETENSANLLGYYKDCVVASTCEAYHLYGMLWRLLYPLSIQMPIHGVLVKAPETLIAIQQQHKNVLFVTTPSFIEAVARHQELYKFPDNICAITTSGGLLKKNASCNAKQIWNTTPIEIFGSTESGGIASRCQEFGDMWNVFKNVEIGVDQRGCLNAQSPYCIGGKFQTNDIAEIISEKQFRFFGRIDRLVKIGETQLYIPDLENHLLEHQFIENCYVDFFDNNLRALLVLNNDGKNFYREKLHIALTKEINNYIKKSFDAKFLLRKIRVINAIPVNAQGKILKNLIDKIFRNKMEPPVILKKQTTTDSFKIEMFFAEDSSYFKGHFPIMKILPGVIQVHFATTFISEFFGEKEAPKTIKKLKFTNVILPNEVLELTASKNKILHSYTFSFNKDGKLCSSGILEF
ncbi:MAG: hypothetical protein E7035_08970 [Verrucomicrobiaceae bacterium]|nr:hypothetical protein [Verrucomicrobiaceae bacterium]